MRYAIGAVLGFSSITFVWVLACSLADSRYGRMNTTYIDVPVGPATGRPRPVRVPEWTYTTTTTRKRLMSRPNDPYPKP